MQNYYDEYRAWFTNIDDTIFDIMWNIYENGPLNKNDIGDENSISVLKDLDIIKVRAGIVSMSDFGNRYIERIMDCVDNI